MSGVEEGWDNRVSGVHGGRDRGVRRVQGKRDKRVDGVQGEMAQWSRWDAGGATISHTNAQTFVAGRH